MKENLFGGVCVDLGVYLVQASLLLTQKQNPPQPRRDCHASLGLGGKLVVTEHLGGSCNSRDWASEAAGCHQYVYQFTQGIHHWGEKAEKAVGRQTPIRARKGRKSQKDSMLTPKPKEAKR